MYLFKKGEVVSFLNDTGTARIVEVRADGTALVETEDGFEYPYPCSELVPRFDLREKEPEPAPQPKMITEMEGFRLGQKVSMAHEDMDGVIMEFHTDGRIRVEWEDLITSWYRPGELRVPGEAEQVKLAEFFGEPTQELEAFMAEVERLEFGRQPAAPVPPAPRAAQDILVLTQARRV